MVYRMIHSRITHISSGSCITSPTQSLHLPKHRHCTTDTLQKSLIFQHINQVHVYHISPSWFFSSKIVTRSKVTPRCLTWNHGFPSHLQTNANQTKRIVRNIHLIKNMACRYMAVSVNIVHHVSPFVSIL